MGVLTNRDVRDSVKPLVHAEPPQPRLQSQDSSRKRPLESSNEPATEELQANRTRNKKLKMALYGMDDEVYDSQEKMGDQLAKCTYVRSVLMARLTWETDWHQRYRLWKRFDEGIKMDREGLSIIYTFTGHISNGVVGGQAGGALHPKMSPCILLRGSGVCCSPLSHLKSTVAHF